MTDPSTDGPGTSPTRPHLRALAQKHGTDKWGLHRYAPQYHRHFQSRRDQPLRVLEIGIGGYNHPGQGGASLRMWKEFFAEAQIVGLDIRDKSFVDEERIKTYQGDQTDEDLLRRIHEEAGPFDLIIDDGSHHPDHVVATFAVLFPLLAPSGIYAVEDLQTSYWPEYGGSQDRRAVGTSMDFFKTLMDGLNHMEFLDDGYEPTYSDLHVTALHCYHNLIFVQKGRNRERSPKHWLPKLKHRWEPATEG